MQAFSLGNKTRPCENLSQKQATTTKTTSKTELEMYLNGNVSLYVQGTRFTLRHYYKENKTLSELDMYLRDKSSCMQKVRGLLPHITKTKIETKP